MMIIGGEAAVAKGRSKMRISYELISRLAYGASTRALHSKPTGAEPFFTHAQDGGVHTSDGETVKSPDYP